MGFIAPFIPHIVAGLSAIASAKGKSGQQGGTNQQQQQQQNTQQQMNTQSGFQTGQTAQTAQTGFQQAIEDPAFASYRESLLPQFQNQLQKLNEPIFGEGQKAGFLGQLNELGAASAENLKQNLARSGATDSGRMSQGLTDIETGRNAQASQFFAQLPFLEQQAQQQRAQGMLGLASNFAGRAPISQVTGQVGTASQQGVGVSGSQQNTVESA